jgi:hypothetical protein
MPESCLIGFWPQREAAMCHPMMDVEACFILALCRRRLLDAELALGRNASADLIAMAALNFVCMTLRKLCVYINVGIV